MITILSRRHAALVFRHLREGRHLSRLELGRLLFVSQKTVANRERSERGITTETLLDTARALGYAVALVPQRHPGVHPTGTGWPA